MQSGQNKHARKVQKSLSDGKQQQLPDRRSSDTRPFRTFHFVAPAESNGKQLRGEKMLEYNKTLFPNDDSNGSRREISFGAAAQTEWRKLLSNRQASDNIAMRAVTITHSRVKL